MALHEVDHIKQEEKYREFGRKKERERERERERREGGGGRERERWKELEFNSFVNLLPGMEETLEIYSYSLAQNLWRIVNGV